MTPTDGAIIVASVGVLGTLFSPLVSNWVAMRMKRQELEFARNEKTDERRHADIREAFVERRNCYATLNSTAREYLTALRARSHAIEVEEINDDTSQRLTETRKEYRSHYAEAQMIVSEQVLRLASNVNGIFAEAYGMLRRIEEGLSDADETPTAVRVLLKSAWDPLRDLRSQMRTDLGLSNESAD